MARSTVWILAVLLAATAVPPLASAHIPSCINDDPENSCADAPDVNDWITCGSTPSTWPVCGIDGARDWCSSECFVYLNVVGTIIFHCVDHARIEHEFCGGDLVEGPLA
jgi:hypothetical protein